MAHDVLYHSRGLLARRTWTLVVTMQGVADEIARSAAAMERAQGLGRLSRRHRARLVASMGRRGPARRRD
jgi:hypothetical protein